MKKKNLLSLAVIIFALIFAACEKDEISTDEIVLDDGQEATIKAYVYAPLDLTSLEIEKAPQGTRFVISADYSDFNPEATGSLSDTLTVDENGIIETTVKVSQNGVAYKITPLDFEAEQKQPITSSSSTIKKMYKAVGQTLSLNSHSHRIIEFQYKAYSFLDEIQYIDIDLYLNAFFYEVADSIKESAIMDPITIVGNSGWDISVSNFTKVMVDSVEYGKTTVNVPVDETMSIIKFMALKTVHSGATDTIGNPITVEKEYLYSKELGSFTIGQNGQGFRFTLDSEENKPN